MCVVRHLVRGRGGLGELGHAAGAAHRGGARDDGGRHGVGQRHGGGVSGHAWSWGHVIRWSALAVLPTVERGEGHHGVVVVHGAGLPVPGVVAGQHAAGGVAQHRHALHGPAGGE